MKFPAWPCILCVLAVTTFSLHAQDEPKKQHHKLWELISALSSEDHAKLKAAKEQALKIPEIRDANERRKAADFEYRELLHREMSKSDPSLKPVLEKITELKKHDDF